MNHTLLVITHITTACAALTTGFLALWFPNGTRGHRVIGVTYMVCWFLLGGSALLIGAENPGITPFEVLTWIGMAQVAYAYGAVIFRKRIGRTWLQKHYNNMVGSMAGLLVATANVLLQNSGLPYSGWVFVALMVVPFFAVPAYTRRLDRRYGFAPDTPRAQPQSSRV